MNDTRFDFRNWLNWTAMWVTDTQITIILPDEWDVATLGSRPALHFIDEAIGADKHGFWMASYRHNPAANNTVPHEDTP